MEHKIIVAGIGPGHPDYVLPIARKYIQDASFLVGGRRALASFASASQETLAITGDVAGVIESIRQHLEALDVVVMVSGDPGYYSLLDALRREFSAAQLQVIPGISSVQFAFARLALPWHDACLISLHGRPPKCEELIYEPGRLLGILTDSVYHSASIAELLLQLGWPADTESYICTKLSYPDEKIISATLQQSCLIEKYAHCVMVVKA